MHQYCSFGTHNSGCSRLEDQSPHVSAWAIKFLPVFTLHLVNQTFSVQVSASALLCVVDNIPKCPHTALYFFPLFFRGLLYFTQPLVSAAIIHFSPLKSYRLDFIWLHCTNSVLVIFNQTVFRFLLSETVAQFRSCPAARGFFCVQDTGHRLIFPTITFFV